ncbi:hypothetical protein ACHAWU_001656 [Discostella pseudostelligera]|uniref:Uncharacterized protein n=1 Tax=Discostella pseudostelligera TaxID=259834 RepID=A0ABD3ML85_9STRA
MNISSSALLISRGKSIIPSRRHHFPDTCGLKYQCKVFLSKGELGEFGSTYYVETVVKKETGESCYKATGEVVLQPKKVPRPDSKLLLPAHVESFGSV